jgi:hypothetical protein
MYVGLHVTISEAIDIPWSLRERLTGRVIKPYRVEGTSTAYFRPIVCAEPSPLFSAPVTTARRYDLLCAEAVQTAY